MPTRDMYIAMLEKRASHGLDTIGVDSQEAANSEHSANKLDQRAEVGNLFASADKASRDTTSAISQALPKAKRAEGTSASNTMLKVAMNTAFFEGLRETGLLKTASPEYLRAANMGFHDELDKIAGFLGTAAKAVGGAVKKVIPGAAKAPKQWGPGTVLQGAAKASKPSTANFGAFT
jgi:hypothetical protein